MSAGENTDEALRNTQALIDMALGRAECAAFVTAAGIHHAASGADVPSVDPRKLVRALMAGGDTVTAMELVVNAIRSQLIYIDRIHELQERLDHAERRLRSANRVLAKIADDNEAAAEAGQRAEGTQALGLHVPCETCGRCKGCGNCKCEAPAKEYRFHSN